MVIISSVMAAFTEAYDKLPSAQRHGFCVVALVLCPLLFKYGRLCAIRHFCSPLMGDIDGLAGTAT